MNKYRLLKLARFLESLEDKAFDFKNVVSKHENSCGSVCCAIGWTPKVFPELIKWFKDPLDWENKLRLEMNGKVCDYLKAAVDIFGITRDESIMLFSPMYRLEWWDDRVFSGSVRPYEVALSIRKFVEWKEEQESQSR